MRALASPRAVSRVQHDSHAPTQHSEDFWFKSPSLPTGEKAKHSANKLQLAFLAIELLMRLSTPRDKPWRFSPPSETPASSTAAGGSSSSESGPARTAVTSAAVGAGGSEALRRPPPRRLLDSVHFDTLLEASLETFEANINEVGLTEGGAAATGTAAADGDAAAAASSSNEASAEGAKPSASSSEKPPPAPHTCATLRSAAMNALLVLAEGDEGRARLVALPSTAPHGGVAKVAQLLLPQLRAGSPNAANFLNAFHRLTWIRAGARAVPRRRSHTRTAPTSLPSFYPAKRASTQLHPLLHFNTPAGAPFPERDRALGAILRLPEAPAILEAVYSHLPEASLLPAVGEPLAECAVDRAAINAVQVLRGVFEDMAVLDIKGALEWAPLKKRSLRELAGRLLLVLNSSVRRYCQSALDKRARARRKAEAKGQGAEAAAPAAASGPFGALPSAGGDAAAVQPRPQGACGFGGGCCFCTPGGKDIDELLPPGAADEEVACGAESECDGAVRASQHSPSLPPTPFSTPACLSAHVTVYYVSTKTDTCE